MKRLRISTASLLGAALLAPPAAAASAAPRLRLEDNVFGRKYVNTYPRPYNGRTNISSNTTFYFEIIVPDTNGVAGRVDPNSITATLVPTGGSPVSMVQTGQVFSSGFSGSFIHGVDAGSSNGEAVYIVPATPLSFATNYRVDVFARTLDGVPIDSSFDSWSFTTRAQIADPTIRWTIGLDGPTVHWNGWFFSGLLKPDFDSSRMFDQLDSYVLMDAVHTANPDAWSLQRDWPMTSDYWHNGVFDGNPNLVRERETRRIIAVQNQGARTLLSLVDLEEGPLYGIPPGRPLGSDFHRGDLVTVADREKFEVAEVLGVDEASRIVKVKQMLTPPGAWILDYVGSHPADIPDTPDNFTLPLCYLRKRAPVGTPVYYWSRLDDEWDIVHGQHGRRLQVNFSYTPLDLSRDPVPASTGGHGSIGPPKDWLQWHEFVRQVVFRLIDRYGASTLDFYYSVGNENNFSTFWSEGKDGYYELYDYTVNAVLTAFEERGLDAGRVQVGGVEAAGLGGLSWIKDALYHFSGSANRPGGGIVEQNYACADPLLEGKRAARVESLCASYSGRGSPVDFVSIHEYEHADLSAQELTQIRDDALGMDPAYYDALNVTCFECTPDWIPRPDPAAAAMYLGNGFFSTWCSDWMQRMVERAESDPRYARHESVLTVWPFDYNGDGISSITGLMRVDDDGDGTEDRISTIKKEIFNFIEALAKMNRSLDALPAQTVAGIRLAGIRSPSPLAHEIMVYAHDWQDTEAREETTFDIQLTLQGIPWPEVTVRRWRVDRDSSSPYQAYRALPAKSLYRPSDLVDLEASDDLVQDGPSVDLATTAGTLDVSAPLRVNGATFLEIRERDGDGDGIGDTADNCPLAVNPGQQNGDSDSRGDACDCAPLNGGAFAVPPEIGNLRFPSGTTVLSWDSAAPLSGSGTVYDVVRGDTAALPVGSGVGEICLEQASMDATAADATTPGAGSAFFYLVRGWNSCGAGPYGTDSSGLPRNTPACP